jgi:hypothetical protein
MRMIRDPEATRRLRDLLIQPPGTPKPPPVYGSPFDGTSGGLMTRGAAKPPPIYGNPFDGTSGGLMTGAAPSLYPGPTTDATQGTPMDTYRPLRRQRSPGQQSALLAALAGLR